MKTSIANFFSFISSRKHDIIRFLVNTLKGLVALAAVLNLVALFVFHYELPSWLRPHESAKYQPETTAEELEKQTVKEKLNIPVIPLNYSGEADLDALIMDSVYLLDADGQPVEDADIQYEILPGESRQKKLIRYTVTLESGDTLTEERVMNLTARYTGPTITLLGALPGIDPEDADLYLDKLVDKGIIRIDDGFGNDASEQVIVEFDGLSDEEPDAEMTLLLENQIHDTYEMSLTVEVRSYTGVVVTLKEYYITLNVGDDFEPRDYINYAHDTEGNDLMDSVVIDNGVHMDEAGNYEVWYWVKDEEGVFSPTKKLHVTVEAEPEEVEDIEEAGETEESNP